MITGIGKLKMVFLSLPVTGTPYWIDLRNPQVVSHYRTTDAVRLVQFTDHELALVHALRQAWNHL